MTDFDWIAREIGETDAGEPVYEVQGRVTCTVVAEGLTKKEARLIAAAPKLLEACLAMIAWDDAEKNAKPFDEDGGAGFYQRIGMCQDAFNAAREAIKEATE